MGFRSFLRDIMVFDWLFGHRKKETFWEQRQRESQRFTDYYHKDDYNSYSSYGHNDYAQQDFDEDLDSGMFDDDF